MISPEPLINESLSHIFLSIFRFPVTSRFPTEIEMSKSLHQNIFIITGKVQSGKTTFLKEVVDAIKSEKFKVAGFLCYGQFNDGERSGFILADTESLRTYQLASVSPKEGWVKFRKFYFDPEILEAGVSILLGGLRHGADLLVIDEVGPMELEGRGWYIPVELMVKEQRKVQLWVVRENILKEVLKRWKISPRNVVPADTDDHAASEQLVERLKRCINH